MKASTADSRPDPDALVRRLRAEHARDSRAKLKIFFGFAPGVGKTYTMLESAARLAGAGVDVVVGCVETHGRAETAALVEGLAVIPKRVIEYRGRELPEFDLEAALARKPKVLLLDELAHTNVPGSLHPKRYQDVLDLLDAGIDVHTTLNVQHVESLNDVVAQLTHVRVRETVPDAVLDRADEIELVDLPPDELLSRLKEGKVYLGEQAHRASKSFFQRGNLLALRELALRRTADRVDADVQAYREEHAIGRTLPAGERILVCVGPAPASARLVRAARRIAAGLRAPWVAAYVEPPATSAFSAADRQRLEAHLKLAESLGGTVERLSGLKVSAAILEYSRKHNVTRILIGKPTHSRLRDLVRGSLLDEIVRGSGEIDVNVISGDAEAPAPIGSGAAAPRRGRVDPLEYAYALASVVVATTLCHLAGALFSLPDLSMIYLFVIMLNATAFGRGPTFLSAALSVVAYDVVFIPPRGTLAVTDVRHVLTFVNMFVIGALVSKLMSRIRAQEAGARERERRTSSLFALSRDLGQVGSEAEAAVVLANHVRQVFDGGVAVFVGDRTEGAASATAGKIDLGVHERAVVRWVMEHGRPAGRGTDAIPGAALTCFPIQSASAIFGVIAVHHAPELDREGRALVGAFAQQAALVIQRTRASDEAKAAAMKVRDEEMRNALLSAVSHDLRTPLATITGAATTLRDAAVHLTAEQGGELLSAICEEAERLERLLSNLLDMTRIQSNGLSVRREWVPIEELVGSVLSRLEQRLKGSLVSVAISEGVPLLSVDPLLVEQLIHNLVENAIKHTDDGSPIDVTADREGDVVEVVVSDRGPGVPRELSSAIFDKFVRGASRGVGGVGLGLAICRGIAEAHGGVVGVRERSGGGASFFVRLPLVGKPPSLDAREEAG